MTFNFIRKASQSLFSPRPSWQLGALRVAFFGWLFLWYLTEDFTFVADYPEGFWKPIQIFSKTGFIEQPTVLLVSFAQIFWKISLLFACIGFFTRASIAVAFILGTYLLGLTHSFNKINHSDAALIFAMLVFLLSYCGHRISLDARFRSTKKTSVPQESAEYGWPIKILQLIWVIVIFLSGVSKIRNGGIEWMLSDNFSNIIVRSQMMWDPPLSFGLVIAQVGWLCNALAIGTVLIELAAILTLFSRWAKMIVVPAMFSMQLGIYFIMGDNFTQFIAMYLAFLPWAPLARMWPKDASAAEPKPHRFGHSAST